MGNEQAVVVSYASNIKRKVGHAKEPVRKDIAVRWDPTWFARTSTVYNADLAVASMALALAAYGNNTANGCIYIAKTFEAMGFLATDTAAYDHRTEDDPSDYQATPDVVAYAFACRTITDAHGEQRPLVAVAIRGTAPTVEWNSNGNVADSVHDGAYNEVLYHEGFKRAEEELLGRLTAYMQVQQIDGSEALVWIVGHSRGAAVANLLAADVDEGALGFATDRVFAYACAAPTCTRRADADAQRFANIFNVVNPEDFIPRLPLQGWGFRRFGHVFYLPSVATAYQAFLTMRPVAEQLFEQIAETSFETFGGTAATNEFVRYALDLCPTLADLYTEPHYAHSGGLTFRRYFYDFTNECAQHGVAKKEAMLELAHASEGAYAPLFSYFFDNQVLQKAIPFGHASEGYLAKLMALQQLGIDIQTLTPGDTVHVTLYGMADVLVVDGDGHGLAAVKRGRVDETFAAKLRAVAACADDTTGAASVWLPIHEGYGLQVAVDADAAGLATALWSVEDPEGNVQTRQVYEGLSVAPETLVAWDTVAARASAPRTVQGAGLAARVTIVGDGDAVGAANAAVGDRVSVEAYHGALVHFKGWFAGHGEPQPDAQPLSTQRTYVFPIEQDCDLTAVFERL